MSDKIVRALRWFCLLLVATIGWQVYGIVTAPEPFDELGDLTLEGLTLESAAGATDDADDESARDTSDSGAKESGEGTSAAPTASETDAGEAGGEGKDQEPQAQENAESNDQKPQAQENAESKDGSPDEKGQAEGKDRKPQARENAEGEERTPQAQEKTESKDQKPQAQEKTEQKKPVSPAFPAALEIVATSGILGKAPETKPAPPALLGTLGKYAMIRSPDGKEDLVAEGGVLGGVKVIRISTNRALVEYQDRRLELTVYAGMGSPTLLETEKKAESKEGGGRSEAETKTEKENKTENSEKKTEEKTEQKAEEKKKADAPEKAAGTDSLTPTPPKAPQKES